MEKLLKEYKSNLSFDSREAISLIAYLACLTKEEIIPSEVEFVSNLLHCCLKNMHKHHYSFIRNVLEERKPYLDLSEKCSEQCFRIRVKDTWLFRIILIGSVKHSDITDGCLTPNKTNLLNTLIVNILEDIIIVKPLSLHLLKTLSAIVTKCGAILSSTLSRVIVQHMNKVALSPFTVFRQYAQGISKAVTPYLLQEKTILLEPSLFPINGVDMCDIVKCFPEHYVEENLHVIIRKVLDMFQKNVESKDGGILYQSVLAFSFEQWTLEIWPLFLHHLKHIDYEGEFFQSLLKYWITINVSVYKSQFYAFIRNEPVDWRIKAHVLLECRKKGCIDIAAKEDILTIFHSIETRDLSLRLASTYHKKSLWPKAYEIDVVIDYLYSNSNRVLEDEEIKSFHLFFSQIYLHVHNELKKNKDNVLLYMSPIERIYKYCCASLKTDFFEVGSEIVLLLWTIATGSHKSLLLNYRLEKKDCYGCGDNLFYKVLKERGTWLFGSPQFYQELIDCYILNQASSIVLTKLFTKHVEAPGFINTINLKSVVEENCLETGLESEKRVKNFSEIVFQNQVCKDNIKFVEEITEYLNKLTVPQQIYLEKEIFRTVLYLQVVIVAMKYNKFNKDELHGVIDKSLEIVEAVLKNNTAGRLEYKTLKILEAFINNIVWCIIDNTNILYTAIQKDKVIKHLIFIIQRSNMKKPLTLSVLALKNLALKMNGSDSEQNYKIQFVEDTLNSLSSGAPKSDLKIRRSPESRLVIHSMCCADSHPNKPLLKWVMDCLLKVISDPKAQDSVLASALHSIEILVSDNNLQNATLSFIPDIIIQCVELFARPSWIVRNADLQLIRAIIDRFYGVCLNVSDRPKSIEDLFVLFPVLSSYFYTILSSVKLDERAVLVFQFFSESQIKERIYATESTDSFLQLFLRIIQKYSNHYAKMAVYSYSSLCSPKAIRNEICSIIRFFKANFELLSKNVFANFVLLIQLLYVKYKKSFECSIDKENIRVIDFALNDLVQVLRKYDGSFFDLILFKTKSQSIVLQEFVHNFDENSFVDRLWLHNNITFLFVNARGTSISSVLRKILFRNISSCIQIKILTILISRFENNEFASCTVEEILGVLLEKSLSVDDADNYLLNCYFKTILLFYRFTNRFNVKNIIIPKTTSNMYKIMIFVLCLSGQNQQVNPQVYNIVSTKYMDFIYFTEELRNDTISTVPYLLENAPVELRLQLLKLVFYSALFGSTYLEAYKCISLISQKTYASVLVALKDFFSVQSLHGWLKDKTLVSRFFNDVVKYIPKHVQEIQSDGYYSEESDILVPKLFLERLVTNEIKKTGVGT